MSRVYKLNPDGTTTRMKRKHSLNEERDLQRILEQNLNLIPGDQIDPLYGVDRRWPVDQFRLDER